MDLNNLEREKKFEETYSNLNLKKVVKDWLLNCPHVLDAVQSNPEYSKPILTLLSDLIINRRVLIESEVGKLVHMFEDDVQETADFISACIDGDLCDYDPMRNQLVVKFCPSEVELERINLMMHPLPMVVRPRKVYHNNMTPYLNSCSDSQVYNSNTQEDVCLDVLNALNRIPLKINWVVAINGNNSWGSISEHTVSKELATLTGEDIASTKKITTEKQFKIFTSQMRVVLKMWINTCEFYLPWKIDRRGRFYDDGYLVKIQGNDFQKSIVEFGDAHEVNEY